jgi:hypothetical protein
MTVVRRRGGAPPRSLTRLFSQTLAKALEGEQACSHMQNTVMAKGQKTQLALPESRSKKSVKRVDRENGQV